MTLHQTDGPPPDRGPAPARLAFTPAAILARANAYAAERAAEVAAAPPRTDPRSSAEILASIVAELDRAQPGGFPHGAANLPEPLQRLPAALLDSIARAIDGGRP